MEQRDYLEKQLEQLGHVLGKLLADLLRLNQPGEVTQASDQVYRVLKTELDQDFEKLTDQSDEEFKNRLLKDQRFDNSNLEKLAGVLFELAQKEQPETQQKLLQKSLCLYEYLDANESVYSEERIHKIHLLRKQLTH